MHIQIKNWKVNFKLCQLWTSSPKDLHWEARVLKSIIMTIVVIMLSCVYGLSSNFPLEDFYEEDFYEQRQIDSKHGSVCEGAW